MAAKNTAPAVVATLPEDISEAQVALDIDGKRQGMTVNRRTFSSGSVGFYGTGKVQGTDGRRYQVSVQAVLIGSKPHAE